MKRLKAALPLLVLVAIGAMLYLSGALDALAPRNIVTEHGQLHALVEASPWLARLAMTGLMALTTATGLPGSIVVVLACGYLFGIIGGTICGFIGLLAGSLVLFFASRHAFRSGRGEPPKLVERVRIGYQQHPFSYTMFVRLVPVFPFGALTVTLAWLRCPLWIFLTASAVGGTIMLIFETAIGSGLAAHLAADKPLGMAMFLEPRILAPLVILALLALVPILFNWHARRRNRQYGSR